MVEKRTFRPLSKATWGIYLFFVAARVFFAFQPGYIHPDEYFQNAEITAGNIFGLTVNTPWEYLPERPCRSILMPTITTGIPLTILKIILGSNKDHYVPSSLLFNAQRASFLFLSLVLDALIVRIARQIRRSPSIALLLISSSYVTLSYHTHPFSNSVEAVVLTMCIAVLSSIVSDVESTANTAGIRMRTFLLGVLFALGTFTRITFVLYGFPLGVTFLIVVGKAALAQSSLRSSPQSSSHSSPPSTPQPSMPKAALRFIASCIPLALGISLGVAVNVIMDSLYFGKLTIVQSSTQETITHWIDMLNPRTWRDLEFQGSLTVTFLNNLLYNLDENNLAEHGLHPRYLHLLVNFPVLYANLAYVGIRTIGEKVIAQRHYTSHSTLVTALAYSGISGVLLLSVMPHQEARFLTPLLIPLVLTLASRVSKLGRTFWVEFSRYEA
ncbi:alpha 1,2 mannosyltransferase [Actinomortierella wolfii]|nr:alpha 1,2 mannosyltransferase [Actinomortierella wolfii]